MPSNVTLKIQRVMKLFSEATYKKETEKIFDYAKSLKLDIFTTVGDIQTANWIKKLKPSAWKISASLLTYSSFRTYSIFSRTYLSINRIYPLIKKLIMQ